MTTLEKLRQKIVNIKDGCEHDVEYGQGKLFAAICPKCHTTVARYPAIRLADVLLALNEEIGEEDEGFEEAVIDLVDGATDGWNLRKDSLDEQSQETIDFLASILLS